MQQNPPSEEQGILPRGIRYFIVLFPLPDAQIDRSAEVLNRQVFTARPAVFRFPLALLRNHEPATQVLCRQGLSYKMCEISFRVLTTVENCGMMSGRRKDEGGRMKDEKQKSEVRRQRPEVRSQKSGVRRRKSGVNGCARPACSRKSVPSAVDNCSPAIRAPILPSLTPFCTTQPRNLTCYLTISYVNNKCRAPRGANMRGGAHTAGCRELRAES